MENTPKQRIKKLVSSDASLLSKVEELRGMKNEGCKQDVVQDVLKDLRKESRSESEEDRIPELMDFVTGYCDPDQRIWNE